MGGMEQAAGSTQRVVSRLEEKPMDEGKFMDDGTSEQTSEHSKTEKPKQSKLQRLNAKFGEKDLKLKKKMADMKLEAKTKAVEMNLQEHIPPQIVGQKKPAEPEPKAVEDPDDGRLRFAPPRGKRGPAAEGNFSLVLPLFRL